MNIGSMEWISKNQSVLITEMSRKLQLTHMEDVMRHQSHKDMYWQMQCATPIFSQQSAFKHHEDGIAGVTLEATAVSYGGKGQLQQTSCAKNARVAHINNDNYN